MNGKWMSLIAVVVAGLLGWGAWVTLGVAGAAPKERVDQIQQRIEDKLDKIQETILELHK